MKFSIVNVSFWTFILLGLTGHAQIEHFNPYRFPHTIPDKYVVDPLINYEKILNEDLGNYSVRDKEIFSEMVSFGEYQSINSGSYYFSWDELENYLNNIKDKLLPDSISKNKVKVRVGYSAEINAFANHTGMIVMNIGYLAETSSEAQIANVLGHELSHYINRDVKSGFFDQIDVEKKGSKEEKKNLSLISAKFSRSKEIKADSTGIYLSAKAGYDVNYAIDAYQILLIERELYNKNKYRYRRIVNVNEENKAHNAIDVLLSSHPDINFRIEKLTEYSKKISNDENSSAFLQGELIFNSLIEKAKLESLYILYQNNNNRKCLEKSLLFHLYDPNNKFYIYFALESLRRIIYLDPDVGEQDFLTERFSNYFKKGEGILSNIAFLIPDSARIKSIEAKKEFQFARKSINNYWEALLYFRNKALELEVTESYLTIALIHLNDPKNYTLFLDKYLDSDSIRFREYAQSLKNDNLFDEIFKNNREIVLMDEIVMMEARSYGYHVRRKKSYEEEQDYYGEIKKYYAKNFPKKEFIPISEYRSKSYFKYNRLNAVIMATSKFWFYAEQNEKREYYEREIEEGDNEDGSETYTFDDDDEEPIVTTNKEKRAYHKTLKAKQSNSDNSSLDELENGVKKSNDILEQNLYVYAPYCWEYFVNNDISKVEFISLFSYRNMTFNHVLKKILSSSREVSEEFEMDIYTVDTKLKMADEDVIRSNDGVSPYNVAKELKKYYKD